MVMENVIRVKMKRVLLTLLWLSTAVAYISTLPLELPRESSSNREESLTLLLRESRAVTCTDPGRPQNGYWVGGPFYVGYRVAYGCYAGYVLRGSEILTCRLGFDGEPYWDAFTPQCFPDILQDQNQTDQCGTPPEPPILAALTSYVVGVAAGYRCIDHYTLLSGDTQLTCMDGSWQGELLECRRLGQCDSFEDIQHGTNIFEGTLEGDRVTFSCSGDLVMLGNSILTCGSDDYWSGDPPKCLRAPVNCGDPDTPANGQRLVMGTQEEAIVNYFCTDTHVLVGDSTRTCLSNGNWSGSLPTCQGVSCSSPVPPSHGQVQYTSTTLGAVLSYRCRSGFVLTGATSCVCTASGQWSDEPPLCTPVSCGYPSPPLAGWVQVTHRGMFNSSAMYGCRNGYGLIGNLQRVCQADGSWSGSRPSCRRGSCGFLAAPGNGRVSFSSASVGTHAVYSCDFGYILSGTFQRTCGINEEWTGSPPQCNPVQCSALRAPLNGNVVKTNGDRVFSIATYTCNHGYGLLGSEERTCQPSGLWTGLPPGCYLIQCGELCAIHNGGVSFNSTVLGSEAVYFCNEGYMLAFGDSIRTCMDNKLWSGTEPCCVERPLGPPNCGPLLDPGNGSVSHDSGTEQGAVAVYSCDAGYMLEGVPERVCQAGGKWSDTEPKCAPVDCGDLPNPQNGRVDLNEGTTFKAVASYSCSEGFDLLGDKDRTCQADGAWSDNAPECIARDCGALLNPENGTVDLSEGTLFGANAKYSCEDGFELNGPSIRTCQPNGSWSTNEPTCDLQDCGTLPDPSNGQVNLDEGTTIGSTAVYTCDEGHTLVGASTRMCQSDGVWANSEPTCQLVDCGVLLDPANGEVNLDNGTTFGSTAVYICREGHTLNGATTTRTCQANGVWSGSEPTCNVIDCGGLPDPPNGEVNLDEGTMFGSRALYSCNEGFVLNGVTTRTCEATGVWSDSEPTCELRDCGDLEDPADGLVDLSNGTTFGSTAEYRCDEGHTLVGASTRMCQSDGVWANSEPTCQLIDCGDLPAPANGQVDLGNGTVFGSVAVYSCNERFELNGPAELRTCQDSGSWSEVAPTCERTQCEDLEPPENGSILFTNAEFIGSVAIYSCRSAAFRLVGVPSRVCTTDGWTGVAPTCQLLADCGGLSAPDNGNITLTTTTEDSIAAYTCDPGHTLNGSAVRTCQASGEWTGLDPTCAVVDCGPLESPENGLVILGDTTFDSQALYTCDNDFVLNGVSSRTCSASGEWTNSAPTCEDLLCPVLPDPLNGEVNVSSRAISSIASYTCNDGFTLVGEEERECMADGQWSGREPICVFIECPELDDPADGVVSVMGRTPGSEAVYNCNPGLALKGNSTRVCLITGEWSGEAPTCEVIMCPVLEDPDNGEVFVQCRVVGCFAAYSCNPGFGICEGDLVVRVCGDDGEWIGDAPTCKMLMECQELEDPEFGSVQVTGNMEGDSATYMCDPPYILQGNASRTCEVNTQGDFQWSGEEPTCEFVMCPSLDDPINGQVTVSRFTVGDNALYSCNTGFFVNGSLLRTCGNDGEWSDEAPTCPPLPSTPSCPLLADPTNGEVALVSTAVGAMASYACQLGFTLTGATLRTCQASEEWSGEEPVCNPVDCGPLEDPDNGVVVTPDGTMLGSSAEYSCNPGFELNGFLSVRICTLSGEWFALTPPTCEVIDCGGLANPVNGVVDLSNGTTLGSVARYSCGDIYELVGEATRNCTLQDTWSGEAPTCRLVPGLVDCGDPGTPENGARELASTNFASLVNYSCNVGFMLEGEATRECLLTTQWSGELPSCVPVMCPVLPDLQDGIVIVSGFSVDSTAVYICNSGFIREGVLQRTCMITGEWSSDEPVCIADFTVDCPSLEDPMNGMVTVDDVSVASLANYSCDFGYVVEGDSARECLPGGIWSSDAPTCERVQCQDPGVPDRGRRIGNDFTAGSRVFFVCNDGYLLVGANVLLCLDDGTYDSPAPVCLLANLTLVSSGLVGKSFDVEFGRVCTSFDDDLKACCRYRQDWSTLNSAEKASYINAVKTVSSSPRYRQLYLDLVNKYKNSFETLAQNNMPEISQFFPWNRYFLVEYENLLRLVDSSLTIPYWDWSLLPLTPYDSAVFDPITGFGNSKNETTNCVTSGPFREGEFEVAPSAGGGCLLRLYNDFIYPNRGLIEREVLSIEAEDFNTFHSSLLVFLHSNLRCFVGGHMCGRDSANDPLYLLHLARVDLVLDRWQRLDAERAAVRYASEFDVLPLTFDRFRLVSDYANNRDFPNNVCIQYSPLQDVPAETTTSSPGPPLPTLGGAAQYDELEPTKVSASKQSIPNCISEEQLNTFDYMVLTEEQKALLRDMCTSEG